MKTKKNKKKKKKHNRQTKRLQLEAKSKSKWRSLNYFLIIFCYLVATCLNNPKEKASKQAIMNIRFRSNQTRNYGTSSSSFFLFFLNRLSIFT